MVIPRAPVHHPEEALEMPDLSLKGVRMPELRLPEMSRDDIGRAIGDARRDVDLSRLDPRRVDLSGVKLPDVDLPRAVTSAAQSAGIIKRPSRVPMVIGGLIIAALVAIAAAMSPVLRPKIDDAARRLKTAMQARRDAMHEDESDADDAHAFDAAQVAPIESSALADEVSSDATPFDGGSSLPEGLGNGVEHLDAKATASAGNAHS